VPPRVMAAQLTDLLRLVDTIDMQVRILHFEAVVPPTLFGAFEILTLQAGVDNAILYRESGLTDELLEAPEEVTRHREIFEVRWKAALDDASSRQMIEESIRTLGHNPSTGTDKPIGRRGRSTR